MAEPPPKYFRLAPGREVRLRGAYLVTCTDVDDGRRRQRRRGARHVRPGDVGRQRARRTQGEVDDALGVGRPRRRRARVALYERLFTAEVPGEATGDPFDDLNPDSRELLDRLQGRAGAGRYRARRGRAVRAARLLRRTIRDEPMLFHRTVGLRDEWANIQKRTTT